MVHGAGAFRNGMEPGPGLPEGLPQGGFGGAGGVGQVNREGQSIWAKQRTCGRPKYKRAYCGLVFQKLDFPETGRSPL